MEIFKKEISLALVTFTKTPPTPVPHEPDAAFVFRKLAKKELREADEEDTRKKMAQQAAIKASMTAEEYDAQVMAARARVATGEIVSNPRDGYDKDVLLKYGIVSWSGPGYDDEPPVDPASQLDDETYDWAANLILDMNVRPVGEESASVPGSSPTERSPQS